MRTSPHTPVKGTALTAATRPFPWPEVQRRVRGAQVAAPAPAPVPARAAAPLERQGPTANGRSSARLLVIDDDLGMVQQLGSLLKGFAQVSFATSGEDGLVQARALRPDLVLLDAEMPGLSGFEVCKALKADPATAGIPVIFATAHREAEVEATALQLGAVDYLRKPLDPVQVLSRLRLHLRGAAPAIPAHAGSSRLLIVDDDAAAVQLMRHGLQHLGECHFALDGEQALDLAPGLQPDLVLLDIDLPGADGFAVCARLKAHSTLRHVPVVFISQSSARGDEARALSLGADDFIAKPYDIAVLRARVGRLLTRKQAVDADLQTLRQQAQRVSDARVAALVAAASDAIVAADDQGRIVLANAAACRLLARSEAELLNQPLAALLTACDAATGADLAELQSGGGRLRCSDGTTLDVELAVSAVSSGADALQVVIVHDLRERARREAADRLLLEAQVRRKAMHATLSFIAHEMGNPLHAISGFTQLMQASAADTPLRAHAKHLALIGDASRQLQGLMHDVIDLTRLETGQLQVRVQDLEIGPVLTQACQQIAAQAAQAQMTVGLTLPDTAVHARADARRLGQCLDNLLSNALKYGVAGGAVAVELHLFGDEPVITVADQGRGMSAQQLEHLFEPYNRLGQEDSSVPGLGLGLALTRQLVQAMGGRLEVHSREAAGTRFSIVLAHCVEGA